MNACRPHADRLPLQIDGPVATVTLCRPAVNAIDDAMLDALDAALVELEASAEVAVLRLHCAQKVFCAGADLEMVGGRPGGDGRDDTPAGGGFPDPLRRGDPRGRQPAGRAGG